MIRTSKEAYQILELPYGSPLQQVKSAYKSLVKQYHPDSGTGSDALKYQQIVEAYEFLTNLPPSGEKKSRVIGNGPSPYAKKADYAAFEKSYKKQKQQKKEDFAKRVEECSKAAHEKERQEEEYKKAMDAIHAILAAEAIKNMIKKKP